MNVERFSGWSQEDIAMYLNDKLRYKKHQDMIAPHLIGLRGCDNCFDGLYKFSGEKLARPCDCEKGRKRAELDQAMNDLFDQQIAQHQQAEIDRLFVMSRNETECGRVVEEVEGGGRVIKVMMSEAVKTEDYV